MLLGYLDKTLGQAELAGRRDERCGQCIDADVAFHWHSPSHRDEGSRREDNIEA